MILTNPLTPIIMMEVVYNLIINILYFNNYKKDQLKDKNTFREQYLISLNR